jgi:hypothetical protein
VNLPGLTLPAAQDALFGELKEAEALAALAVDLGFPTSIQPDHVWVQGAGDGSTKNELSGSTAPSAETFHLTVFCFASHGLPYVEVRDAVMVMAGAVFAALDSSAFAAIAPAWKLSDYTFDEGTDGSNIQVALELVLECRVW